jgi:carboxyl-terminal processing protease
MIVAGAVAVVAIVEGARAQPIPDDDPLLPQWRARIARVDSLLRRSALPDAIDLLEELRGSPIVRDRDEDYARLLMTLARTYALAGDVDRSFERASEAYRRGYSVRNELSSADEFALVRGDPRFEQLIADAERHETPWRRLWSPRTELARWSDTLSLSHRMYGVAAIWSAARHSYAYFDRIGTISWDSIYLAALDEATTTRSTVEYYLLLQRMVAQLRDGHTTVLAPPELIDSIGYYPPVRTALVEGHVLIVAANGPDVPASTVHVGDEIIAIDGVPVHEYAAKRVRALVSSSSERDRHERMYDQYLLGGASDAIVTLDLRRVDGSVQRQELIRFWCWEDLTSAPTVDFTRMSGNVGYIAINTFHDEYVVQLLDMALERLADTRAMIVDVRANTGGYSRLAFDVLSRFMSTSFTTHRWETPAYRAYFHARDGGVEWHREEAGSIPGRGEVAYAKPVVLLVGGRTMSAAENFAVAFDYAGRGTIIGERTAGSTGHGMFVPLPGGGLCRITTTRDYYPDGREYNAVGVTPTITIAATVADIQQGRDAVLDSALGLIRIRLAE